MSDVHCLYVCRSISDLLFSPTATISPFFSDGKIIHSGMTMPMLDPSNSVVLSGGFPLDTQKTTDGHAPSIEWSVYNP